MTTTNKARKAQIVYNGIELEAYQLPNGEYNLSKTQVGKAIEKHRESLSDFLKGTSPEALPFKDCIFDNLSEVQIDGNNTMFHGVPFNLAYDYWFYHASKGWKPAQVLIETLSQIDYVEGVEIFGANFKQHVVFTKKRKVKPTTPEKNIQSKLNEKLTGLLEVSTPVGKIDILTDKLLIEIKKAKDWKAAIGQLLMYGHYYPKHQKVLYLFELYKNIDLDLISHLCSEFNITVATNITDLTTTPALRLIMTGKK